jgi:hypothetical protein
MLEVARGMRATRLCAGAHIQPLRVRRLFLMIPLVAIAGIVRRWQPLGAAEQPGRGSEAPQCGRGQCTGMYGRIISLSSWSRMWQCTMYAGPTVGSNEYWFCPGDTPLTAVACGAQRITNRFT